MADTLQVEGPILRLRGRQIGFLHLQQRSKRQQRFVASELNKLHYIISCKQEHPAGDRLVPMQHSPERKGEIFRHSAMQRGADPPLPMALAVLVDVPSLLTYDVLNTRADSQTYSDM